MYRKRETVWFCLFALFSFPSHAQEDLDDVLEGFDEPPVVVEQPLETDHETGHKIENKNKSPQSWNLKGFMQTSLSYNYAHKPQAGNVTDYRGLSQLKQSLQLEWEATVFNDWKVLFSGNAFYDFSYIINNRDNYTHDVLEEHEREAEIREAYVQGALHSKLDLKLGRQIVVWGTSDTLRVVDVLNPLDNREPGMTDLEDLRLPVAMTRLDYYPGSWNLTTIVVHEVRFNKNPAYGSDFYPLPIPLPPEKKTNGQQAAMALSGHLQGWDISLHGARYYSDQPHLRHGRLEHSRLTMAGLATNIALGNWLLKAELAWIDGLQFANLPDDKRSRLDTMAGFEYSGFHETMIALEFVNRHLNRFTANLSLPPDSIARNQQQIVLRYQQDFKHDTWHLLALTSAFGPSSNGGAFARLELKYDIADALSITTGLITYKQGDHPVFGRFGNNDRVFAKLRYSF